LIVNFIVKIVGKTLSKFYIFKGERLHDDYIKLCKQGTCMAMQRKTWMTSFLFKKFMFFFKRSILGGISFINRIFLLILDEHGFHVTLETIKQTQEFGLNMITLLSHTNHAL
jgi:hypothetical protein